MNAKKIYLIIIILSSLLTHFLFFGHPKETVFDEVHFGKFISGYFTHQYFFDIHPPLGKLLISGMGYLTGFQPGFGFEEIGKKFPNNNYLWLRLLPTLAGVLLSVVIFYLALRLGMSKIASFSASMFIILENSILTQSRFILLDSFLLLFGFGALLAYLSWRNSVSKWSLLLAGVLAGAAVSVKWTGLTFLIIIAAMEIFHLWKDRLSTTRHRLLSLFCCLVVAPIIIYFGTFVIHFGLLSQSGPGNAFMTPAFQKTLGGNSISDTVVAKPLNLLQKFTELNIEMYRANATLTATHPYSSKWYTWPFMIRPIYYWYQSFTPDLSSRIYFLGNPIIWWASTIAILYLLLNLLSRVLKGKTSDVFEKIPFLLVGAYLLNLLPFIGINRAMFLYHYMTALVFTILCLTYLIDQLQKKRTIFTVLLTASLIIFVFLLPLTYGLPLNQKAYQARLWLTTWQ